uniref:Uncharacterized protein n=1 Tax=Oryza sativa subsp. japonica TaxID=39947 RepID=Q2R259_ORYSJ|nr:hypothetical protein LOC_Os11g36910 [Oryza sativa Japonica Group]
MEAVVNGLGGAGDGRVVGSPPCKSVCGTAMVELDLRGWRSGGKGERPLYPCRPPPAARCTRCPCCAPLPLPLVVAGVLGARKAQVVGGHPLRCCRCGTPPPWEYRRMEDGGLEEEERGRG